MSAFVTTRISLHAVAEQLLGGDLRRRTSRIGLRVTPDGFGQPEHFVGDERRRLRVDLRGPSGPRLVVLRGDVETWHPLSSLRTAAADAGAELGAAPVYEAQTALDPDAPLALDAPAAARLGRFLGFATEALEQFRRQVADRHPTIVQLWPEHFDLGFAASEINFGASVGDADHDAPYLYVGPWTLPPPEGPEWNETWGASLTWTEDLSLEDAVSFLSHCDERARG